MSHRNLQLSEINWQPVTGCTEIGPGCDSCPSLEIAKNNYGVPGHDFESGFNVRLWENRLRLPLQMVVPKKFMVCLGSDLFHDQVPTEFIARIFQVMNTADYHVFEICTKRADRMHYLGNSVKWYEKWTPNIAMGVTVATKNCLWRIDALRNTPAKIKYVSASPLLENLGEINLSGIDFMGAAAEDWGPKRGVDMDWVQDIEAQCKTQNVKFSFAPAVNYA